MRPPPKTAVALEALARRQTEYRGALTRHAVAARAERRLRDTVVDADRELADAEDRLRDAVEQLAAKLRDPDVVAAARAAVDAVGEGVLQAVAGRIADLRARRGDAEAALEGQEKLTRRLKGERGALAERVAAEEEEIMRRVDAEAEVVDPPAAAVTAAGAVGAVVPAAVARIVWGAP
jgi:hypothetical protein